MFARHFGQSNATMTCHCFALLYLAAYVRAAVAFCLAVCYLSQGVLYGSKPHRSALRSLNLCWHAPQDVLEKLKADHLSPLQARLFRSPLGNINHQHTPGEAGVLVTKLANLVSMKGEDVMLTTPTSQMQKYHRLRASVPSRLWKWRILSSWKWTGQREHINSLELRACFTTLKWRVIHQKLRGKRFLHLTDSLVSLHCLTRSWS